MDELRQLIPAMAAVFVAFEHVPTAFVAGRCGVHQSARFGHHTLGRRASGVTEVSRLLGRPHALWARLAYQVKEGAALGASRCVGADHQIAATAGTHRRLFALSHHATGWRRPEPTPSMWRCCHRKLPVAGVVLGKNETDAAIIMRLIAISLELPLPNVQ